jgi:hypothetical protein
MKKVLSIVMCLTLVLALASCTGNTTTSSTEDVSSAQTPVSSEDTTAAVGGDKALEVLNNIYAQYPDDYKVFGGGDEANMNWEGPGKYGVSDAEVLTAMFQIPAESIAKVSGAANLMSMMMQNQFTAAAFELVNPADKEALANELTTALKNAQWICGFPENIIVASVGDVVVSVYGFKDLTKVFEDSLKAAYPDATIYTSEALEIK